MFSGPNSRPRAAAAQILRRRKRPRRARCSERAHAGRLPQAKVKSWVVCPHFVKVAPYSENVSFRDFFFFWSWELRTRPLTEEARTAGAAGTTGLKGHFKQKLKNHNDLCVCVCV